MGGLLDPILGPPGETEQALRSGDPVEIGSVLLPGGSASQRTAEAITDATRAAEDAGEATGTDLDLSGTELAGHLAGEAPGAAFELAVPDFLDDLLGDLGTLGKAVLVIAALYAAGQLFDVNLGGSSS